MNHERVTQYERVMGNDRVMGGDKRWAGGCSVVAWWSMVSRGVLGYWYL